MNKDRCGKLPNGKEYEVDYDLDNRIIKVDVDNNDVEYRYDALGRRVIRQEGSTKTALIWWGNSECAEHKHQAGQTVIQNDIMAHPSRLNSVIAKIISQTNYCYTTKALIYQSKRANTPTGFKGFN